MQIKGLIATTAVAFTLSAAAIAATTEAPNADIAGVSIGAAAPDFELTDHTGEKRKLSDYAGKTVVLEWTNYECPFVRKHYDSNNMQGLQKSIGGKDDVVWLSIVSSAPGKQGHLTADTAATTVAANDANSTAVLLDSTGNVGRTYGAQTTPHMYVINDAGNLAYMGAIDSISSFKQEDIAKSENYVVRAEGELAADKEVSMPITTPYGCSVKY